MPRHHIRKTLPARRATLERRDLPAWARAIVAEHDRDLQILNRLRFEPGSCVRCLPLVAALADSAEQRYQGMHWPENVRAVIELLDLLPGIIENLGEFPWVKDALRRLFEARLYFLVSDLRKRVPKVGTGRDEQRAEVLDHVMAFGSAQAARGLRKKPPRRSDVLRSIVKVEREMGDVSSVGSIEQSLTRVKKRAKNSVKAHRPAGPASPSSLQARTTPSSSETPLPAPSSAPSPVMPPPSAPTAPTPVRRWEVPRK